MAAFSAIQSTFDTAAGSTITNVTPITPVINDLLLVVVGMTGNASAATPVTDNNPDGGGSYSLVLTALRNTSADNMAVFVRNSPVGNTSATTVTATIGTQTGAFIVVLAVSGMALFGVSAIRLSKRDNNYTSGNPLITYPGNALPQNLQFTGYNTNLNPPGVSGPDTIWTQRVNGGYITPTTGFQMFVCDSNGANLSGSAGRPDQVQWGGSGGSLMSDFAVELDCSGLASDTPLPPLGRGATW